MSQDKIAKLHIKQRKLRHLLAAPYLSADKCLATCWKAGPYTVWQLFGKTNSIIQNVLPSFFFPQAFKAEHEITWYRISFWTLGVSYTMFPPSVSHTA